MSDDKPELTTEEARQGDRHRTNLRVLLISTAAVIIAFIGAFIYNQMTSPDTETTTPAGESIEDIAPGDAPIEGEPVEPGTPPAADEEAGEFEIAP